MTDIDVMDKLVTTLLDKKSISNPLFRNSSASNKTSEHEQKIANTTKLLINQIKHLETKIYSLSLEVKDAKEQLNSLLGQHDLKATARQVEDMMKLMSYLHGALNKGVPPENIKQEIISKGWPEKEVEKLFNAVLPNL